MKDSISIPSFIQGRLEERNENKIVKTYNDGFVELEVSLYEPKKEELEKVASVMRREVPKLQKRTTKEIIEVLGNVGDRWKSSDQYKQCLQNLPIIYSRSPETVAYDLKGFEYFLNKKTLEELVNHEFESGTILDEWVLDKGIYKTRQPHGLVFHNVAGNSPMVAIGESMGLLTKNANLVKTASGDPLTSEKLAEVITEEDKDLAKGLSVFYWRGETEPDLQNELYSVLLPEDLAKPPLVDASAVWGSERSVATIKRMSARAGIPVIEHGPKYSLDVFLTDSGLDQKYLERVIEGDIISHNQEACNSARTIFVRGDGKKLAQGLTEAFAAVQERNPKKLGESEYKKTTNLRIKYLLDRADNHGHVYTPKGGKLSWTVVYLDSERKLSKSDLDSCTNRFIIVKEIKDENEVTDFVRENDMNRYLQRVGIYGDESERAKLGRDLTLVGADAITYPGMLSVKLPGESHDGFYNLRAFTRFNTMVSGPNNLSYGH